MKIIGTALMALSVGLFSVSAFAAVEGVSAPKTFADFQKEYSGTKPVVAQLKYFEYLSNAPRPTLDEERIR